ncbi:DUF4440 domain-containing protein [Halovenus rubra]|uniref:DUF4440 domain-containing protein n=2 Tax=Halovenus rubra TaxID=869890 RepID=A0ACC7E187_9EURY|nr:DUF4440 domain-containing protein [Halovenus rubra]
MDAVDYRTEIESLHTFFVDWFTGVANSTAFDQVERALAPDYEMVTPSGAVHDRDATLSSIRDSHAVYEPGSFDIDIRNVEIISQRSEVSIVRYEEWQQYEEVTGRLSTAVFAPVQTGAADQQALEWRYLQETWLDE